MEILCCSGEDTGVALIGVGSCIADNAGWQGAGLW